MITIKNVKTLAGVVETVHIPSFKDHEIKGDNKLLLIPGVIDPHMCLGSIDSENWPLAIQSAIQAGITAAIDLPQEVLLHRAKKDLERRNNKIAKILLEVGIALNHLHYLRYSEENLHEIDHLGMEKQLVKGVIIRLPSSKKELLDGKWDNLFRHAAQEDLPVVIDENSKREGQEAERATSLENAIHYTEKWGNRLYVLNVSTQNEIHLIQEARKRSLLVYAETTPYHLFSGDLAKSAYLFEAINNDIIETIGSGFDIHNQKQDWILPEDENSIFSDLATLLPLLLNAVSQKKISIEKVIRLTSLNIQDILEIDKSSDVVLVDLEKEKKIEKVILGESVELNLKGWPVYTIIQGQVFSCLK